MVARHFYRNDAGTLVEVTQYLKREDWETREGAEEGQSESSTLRFYDPEMVLDFVPHRRYIIFEDESEDANQVIFSGFVQMDDAGRSDQEIEPLGRIIMVTLNDMNTLFDNRVMVGGTDRPEETDVARITWVAESEEMGYFEDLTYLSSASTVTLDARDVAGQTTRQIFDEAAQDSDKNYWIGCYGEIGDTSIFLWYGKPTLSTYASPLTLLSNDPADWNDADLEDGTSLVWPISDDTKRHRTGERIYSGVLVEYEGGRKYRKRTATLEHFSLSGRDLVHPAPEIKTSARAGRRADRLLRRLDEPDVTIKTTVRLPASKATMLRAGMRVPFKATHIEEVATPTNCRILNATHKPVSGGRFYDITMELEPISAATSCSAVLSNRESFTVGESAYVAPGTISLPFTTTITGLALGVALASNSNTPADADVVGTGGWTTEYSGETPTVTHPAIAILSKSVSAGSHTMTASYTPGYSPADASTWTAMAVVLETASTDPVQIKSDTFSNSVPTGTVTLDAAPTAGNVLVMVIANRVAGNTLPSLEPVSGWTLVEHIEINDSPNYDNVFVLMRCVADGDTSTYGYSGVSAYTQLIVMEWSLT